MNDSEVRQQEGRAADDRRAKLISWAKNDPGGPLPSKLVDRQAWKASEEAAGRIYPPPPPPVYQGLTRRRDD